MISEEKRITEGDIDMSLFGALPSGKNVCFTLCVPSELEAHGALLRIHSDGYEGEITYLELPLSSARSDMEHDAFEVTLDTCELSERLIGESYGLFYYEYELDTRDGVLYLGGERPRELVSSHENGERQLLIHKQPDSLPSIGDGIIYHIFVDRFRKSGRCHVKDGAILNEDWEHGIPQFAEYPGGEVKNNMFFGGDLYGIVEKLPYIASLGASTVYLSPVFDAASNHKYDTADYMTVDEMFGGDAALELLCREAERYGIAVMLDGVFNHTGSDSVYFNKEGNYGDGGAYRSKSSPYYPWYTFTDYPDSYECWWGIKILPRVKSDSDGYLDFICGQVVPKWMSAGVRHWRLDVADELSDRFLDRFSERVHEASPDACIVGEVWEDASDKVSYGRRRRYLSSGQLSSVMNYPLRNAVISYVLNGECELLRRATEGLYRRYPKHVSDSLMNFLGTHDTERALTVFGDSSYGELSNAELAVRRMSDAERERAVQRLIEAYAIICALPGVPCVFYGDEAGVEGYRDPFCRKTFPWNAADVRLTEEYRRLGKFRQSEALLRDASFELVTLDAESFSFVRRGIHGEGGLYAVFNNTDAECSLTPELELRCMDGTPVEDGITLPPRGYAYFRI